MKTEGGHWSEKDGIHIKCWLVGVIVESGHWSERDTMRADAWLVVGVEVLPFVRNGAVVKLGYEVEVGGQR